jgi:hypothetical protein
MLLSPLTRKRVLPAALCSDEGAMLERAVEFAFFFIGTVRETGRPTDARLLWQHLQYPDPRYPGDIGDLIGRHPVEGSTVLHLQLRLRIGVLPDQDVLIEVAAAPIESAWHGVIPPNATLVSQA